MGDDNHNMRCAILLIAFAFALCRMSAAFDTTIVLEGMPEQEAGHRIPVRVCGPDSTDAETFPLAVFMHAIGETAHDYPEFCGEGGMASKGYVVALVNSYTDFDVYLHHLDGVGHDIHLTSKCLLGQASTNETSPIYGLLSGEIVQIGHSLGASDMLIEAAGLYEDKLEDSNIPQAMAAWAPAGAFGTPVFDVVDKIDVPTLLLVGSKDCNPTVNASVQNTTNPLYEAMTTSCKALVVLKDGNHCNFSTPTVGQCAFDGPCGSLSPTDQQADAVALSAQFFESTVGGASLDAFTSLLQTGADAGTMQYKFSCGGSGESSKFDTDTCGSCSFPPPPPSLLVEQAVVETDTIVPESEEELIDINI